jgi:hypothetical protein
VEEAGKLSLGLLKGDLTGKIKEYLLNTDSRYPLEGVQSTQYLHNLQGG